jgi:hypothetical protein
VRGAIVAPMEGEDGVPREVTAPFGRQIDQS